MVKTISELTACQKKVGGNPSKFASSYTGAVAKYVNLAASMTRAIEPQFALILPGFANFWNTIIELMYQLALTKSITSYNKMKRWKNILCILGKRMAIYSRSVFYRI